MKKFLTTVADGYFFVLRYPTTEFYIPIYIYLSIKTQSITPGNVNTDM